MFGLPVLRSCVYVGCVVAAVMLSTRPAAANGKSEPAYTLEADFVMDQGSYTFSSRVDPLLFSLTTVARKYHVVRIQCRNDSRKDLKLSHKKDAAFIFASGKKADAIISLSAAHPQAWDTIPAELREEIVYPKLVEAGEEEDLLLFIDVEKASGPPDRLVLKIKSLDKDVELLVRQSPVAAH